MALKQKRSSLAPYKNTSRGWRTIGGKKKFFLSKWEANYARYLEALKEEGFIEEWEYEPKTFWFDKIKRGVRSYTPDFEITHTDGTKYFDEIKGYLDSRSKTKLNRMRIYYPSEKINVINKEWFKENYKLKMVIKEWE